VRFVLQRVSSASVTIDGTVRGPVERGLLILLGVADIRVRGHPRTVLVAPSLTANFPPMALTSTYLAEELLSLPPEQRQQLANLLIDSLRNDGASADEVKQKLRARIADLRTGRDPGLSFDDVFGEKA
jgi:putative addiction module component (TIGR02574 family)